MTPRPLDHLVVAVHDLDAAGRFYERLGFQVGARNRHPWGTENRLVQMPGCFIEIITVGEGAAIEEHVPGRFSFGAFVRDYLARREGLAMVVLASEDARADAAGFAAAGIGAFEPFDFERRGRRPDGSEVHVAFTLGFARDGGAPDAGFFVCQQHFPENFWNPAFQVHPNGATGINEVVLASRTPENHVPFLTGFTGAQPRRPGGDGVSFPLPRGRIDVVDPDDAARLYGSVLVDEGRPGFVAFAVLVPQVGSLADRLLAEGVPHQRDGARLLVPSSAAFGVAIAFEPGEIAG